MAGNKNAKKKGVGQRKNQQRGKSRQRGGEKQQDPAKRRVLKPKLKTASTGNYGEFFVQQEFTFVLLFLNLFFQILFPP